MLSAAADQADVRDKRPHPTAVRPKIARSLLTDQYLELVEETAIVHGHPHISAVLGGPVPSIESRGCSTSDACEAKADQEEQHRRAKPSGDSIFARGTVRAFALFGGDVVERLVIALAAKGSC